MQRLDDLINSMPMIPNGKPVDNSQAMNILAMRQTINQMVSLLGSELPKAISNINPELSKNLSKLTDSVEDMNRAFTSKGENLGKIMPKLQSAIGDLKLAIGAIQFPEDVRISNLSSLIGGLSRVEDAVKSLKMPSVVDVGNLGDIDLGNVDLKLPEKLSEALSRLSNPSKEPSEYIPVRLSNGTTFYDGISQAVGSAVSLAPTPGNAVRGSGTSGALALSGTAAERITTSETGITRVTITVTNGPVAVGFDSSVSAVSGSEVGVLIYPASPPYDLAINDLSKVYFAGASGRRVCYAYS